jgi:hypothetical protein
MEQIETAFEADLRRATRGSVLCEQDAKARFRRLMRRMGGAVPDHLSREFRLLTRTIGLPSTVRFYEARAAITTDMNRAGVPDLELRYLTGHATSDILNDYVSLAPEEAMARYFERIAPLLTAIEERYRALRQGSPA